MGWLKGLGALFGLAIGLLALLFFSLKSEEGRIEKRRLASRELHDVVISRFGKLITYEEYEEGNACIGLSSRCKGTKSRGATVCKECYLAQGFDRPIGFAQSGGGATKGELKGVVLKRLGYYETGNGTWKRD